MSSLWRIWFKFLLHRNRQTVTTKTGAQKPPKFARSLRDEEKKNYRRAGSSRDSALVTGIAQHIAAAPDSLDVMLAARCSLQFLAQFADEHIDDL